MDDDDRDAAQQQREQEGMPDFDIGEYITSAANSDNHLGQQDLDNILAEFQPHGPNPSQESTMLPQNLLGSQAGIDYLTQSQSQTMITAEMLKGRLEWLKLQQLQQLQMQNQILQRQIELISGHSPIPDPQFHGLPTPGPSTELRAMGSSDLVSPMMLQPVMYSNDGPSATAIVNQLPPHHPSINPSFSAPAALAFQTSSPFPLPSPGEPGFTLTSPWLHPVTVPQHQQQPSARQLPSQQQQQRPMRLKRAMSIGRDDQGGVRKRLSTGESASVSHSRRNAPSSSSSSTSTPAMQDTGSGAAMYLTPSNDTPSPVDLSMPPPAPPTSNASTNAQATVSSSASSSASLSRPGSTSVSPNIAPVTPASIMNLGLLPTGLIPFKIQSSTEGKDNSAAPGGRRSAKGKGVARPGAAGANGAATRGRRASAKPSPSLKAILPGAILSGPTSPLAQPSSSSQQSSPNFALPPNTAGGLPARKQTTHKAAEQKRRDSLKTSFNELRLLLPPVPLPEDAGDEPPLPGSMPPRGPPKGDADGPNRSVSKLALLRCGNAYICELKAKVGRRDVEIERLRAEVKRLREMVGDDCGDGGVDVDRDVDEGVIAVGCMHGHLNACGLEDGGMDGDEEGD